MVANSSVATHHFHVTDLAFTVVIKTAIWKVHVVITVMASSFASDNEDYVVIRRRDYATLTLAGKVFVDVLTTIVLPADDKAQSHAAPDTKCGTAVSNLNRAVKMEQSKVIARFRLRAAFP